MAAVVGVAVLIPAAAGVVYLSFAARVAMPVLMVMGNACDDVGHWRVLAGEYWSCVGGALIIRALLLGKTGPDLLLHTSVFT